MAPRPRDNTIEIELANLLPCSEWFDLYSLTIRRSTDNLRRMLTGFNCLKAKRQNNRLFYFIDEETKDRLIAHLEDDKNNRGLNVDPMKPKCTALELAKLFPVNEWFNLYSIDHGIQRRTATGIMKRFKCLKSKFKGGILHYYLNDVDKIKLIKCIEDNPTSKEFDISVVNSDIDKMWHDVLGTKQGVKS